MHWPSGGIVMKCWLGLRGHVVLMIKIHDQCTGFFFDALAISISLKDHVEITYFINVFEISRLAL